MKAKIRSPFLEIGTKNYIYGEDVLKLANAADAASREYDIDILFTTPYMDIRMIAEQCGRLIIIAPYMDVLRPGRGLADILPESIKAAGAHGVVLNHCEKPMTLSAIKQTIERANELDLLTFACADSIVETKAIALFHPDIINPEPSELIGTGATSDLSFVKDSTRAVKDIHSDILVEQAAGITTARQVYDNIMAGADGVGSASGIIQSSDPFLLLHEMAQSVYQARNDLARK